MVERYISELKCCFFYDKLLTSGESSKRKDRRYFSLPGVPNISVDFFDCKKKPSYKNLQTAVFNDLGKAILSLFPHTHPFLC